MTERELTGRGHTAGKNYGEIDKRKDLTSSHQRTKGEDIATFSKLFVNDMNNRERDKRFIPAMELGLQSQ